MKKHSMTSALRATRGIRVLSLGLAFAFVACANRQHLDLGQQLLRKGQFAAAIDEFQEALKETPANAEAQKGIREARRGAVRTELDQADKALQGGQFAEGLRHALLARGLPLDLEDVDLVRRIDDTIGRAAQLAEEQARGWMASGRYIDAVDLADQIVEASPGVASRKGWADEVHKTASEHYLGLASQYGSQGLPGSAAIQLALALRVGASVERAQVEATWGGFAQATCFAAPSVKVADRSGKAADAVALVEASAKTELDALRNRCGEGTRPLGASIELARVAILDETKATKAAKPLPGVTIETEEVYVEETPYTEVEEVTEYDTRIEKKELRDCAPRPGQPRGCRTWTEEQEVKVPRQVKREVQKVRRVEKRRPITTPLPEDKVLQYEVRTTTRRVTVEGTISVEGFADARKFSVVAESVDSANDAVTKAGLTIQADPLEVKALEAVRQDAASAVANELRAAVAAAVASWSTQYGKVAQERFREGMMPQAEEEYLRLLALGVGASEGMDRFFNDRYGKSVGSLMTMLAVALGRAPDPRKTRQTLPGEATARFPTRTLEGEATPETPAPPKVDPAAPVPPVAPKTPAGGAAFGMSDDELKALEDDSLQEQQAKPPETTPTDGEGADDDAGESEGETKPKEQGT